MGIALVNEESLTTLHQLEKETVTQAARDSVDDFQNRMCSTIELFWRKVNWHESEKKVD